MTRVALCNPCWRFEGSIYFGCREPHLPLELGYARALLERAGHRAEIFDGTLFGMDDSALAGAVSEFAPDLIVVPTAPSYLFWRCAPPELGVPKRLVRALRRVGGAIVAVGPHGSSTPRPALEKLGVDAVVLGECEDVIVRLAERPPAEWPRIGSIAHRVEGRVAVQGGSHTTDMRELPPLRWPDAMVRRHLHHHHQFDREPAGPGAEIEWSRGCPYHCTFCAKEDFRNAFRRRPLEAVLDELDALISQGVRYVYFIDEIFMPSAAMLEALCERDVVFGVQLRINLWAHDYLELLGRAGCVSIEAGVESLTPEGRQHLTERLIHARAHVPFVQANLLDAHTDDRNAIASWRNKLGEHGVWANEPVPLFPYPGSPEYVRRWGAPDERAWERAHEHYLQSFERLPELKAPDPRPLAELEA